MVKKLRIYKGSRDQLWIWTCPWAVRGAGHNGEAVSQEDALQAAAIHVRLYHGMSL